MSLPSEVHVKMLASCSSVLARLDKVVTQLDTWKLAVVIA